MHNVASVPRDLRKALRAHGTDFDEAEKMDGRHGRDGVPEVLPGRPLTFLCLGVDSEGQSEHMIGGGAGVGVS